MINITEIVNIPGYFTTTKGRVFKEVKGHINSEGYRQFRLADNNVIDIKDIYTTEHKIVLTTFVGPRLKGMGCRHLNGNKLDNKLENLCWGTAKENAADQEKHGTRIMGEKHPAAKLNDDKIRQIHILLTQDHSLRSLANKFNVSRKTIARVRDRKLWKHIP